MSLLPSSFDRSQEEGEPRIVGVESEEADEIFAALASETARSVLCALHDEPAPPAELAERVDTTIQNVQYHLEKLESAGAVEVIGTAYSEKGREMNVYGPADQPLVIFAGDERESALRTALSRLLRSVGVLALASLAVQGVFGEQLLPTSDGPADEPADGDAASPPADDADDAPDTAPEDGDTADAPAAEEPEEEPASDETEDSAEYDSPDVEDDDTADSAEEEFEMDESADVDDTGETADGFETLSDGLSDGATTFAESLGSLPPGVLFFLTGLLVAVLGVTYLYYAEQNG